MISYDPRITIQWDRRVRSGGRVAYGKPINFAGMKKICMFVASYIQSGRVFCLFVAGIFYALTLHIHGFVPPCGALMRPLPLWCRTTGKAEPFFISARQTFSVMSNTREKCLNGKITPRSNRPAHDTSESIYSKFLIEKQAKIKPTVISSHKDCSGTTLRIPAVSRVPLNRLMKDLKWY